MAEEIVMPRLSDTMEEGTIAQWLKHEGETVHKGEAILEVETDKATMPLEAYSEGVIQKILQPEGTTVPIGTVIGLLAKPGEIASPSPSPAAASVPASPERSNGPQTSNDGPGNQSDAARMAADPSAAEMPEPAGGTSGDQPFPSLPSDGPEAHSANNGTDGRIKATPLARNLARQHNIDLLAVDAPGSGPGGRIVKLDIERYIAQQGAEAGAGQPSMADQPAIQPEPAPPAAQPVQQEQSIPAAPAAAADGVEFQKPNRIQQVMARRLLESKTTVPHFYVQNEVDMAAAADLRKQLRATLGDDGKVSFNDLVIKACALALRAMPDVNRQWRDNQFAALSHVNVGVAVDIPDGLVVPVVYDADRKTLREISVEVRDLAARAREGKLTPREMEGGTFTVSNLGSVVRDVEEFQAIINPPESAILAVAGIQDKPVALNGEIVIRPRMKLTLSVDHRVIPGAPAALFLQKIKQFLQEPLRLGF